MENKKCSFKEHKEIDAVYFCQECKVFMCKKCEIFHSKLLEGHYTCNMNTDINEIFTGQCKEENHNIKLSYFCKNHNQLCCGACLSKIKDEINGQHKDCEVCNLEEIKTEKKNLLNENIKLLENLSNEFEKKIDDLKTLFEKINKNKEELKLQIQKLFTKIRNEINEREDKFLSEVGEKYNNLYFKEELIKESEKMPNSIKISLEKGKKLNKE